MWLYMCCVQHWLRIVPCTRESVYNIRLLKVALLVAWIYFETISLVFVAHLGVCGSSCASFFLSKNGERESMWMRIDNLFRIEYICAHRIWHIGRMLHFRQYLYVCSARAEAEYKVIYPNMMIYELAIDIFHLWSGWLKSELKGNMNKLMLRFCCQLSDWNKWKWIAWLQAQMK